MINHWDNVYKVGDQQTNKEFPEQFLVKFFYSEQFPQEYTCTGFNLLDVGSGFGRNVPLFKKFTNNVTCVDPSHDAVNYVKNHYQVTAKAINPEEFSLDEKFEVIVACNSIYYAKSENIFLTQFKKLVDAMCPGGVFIFSFIGYKHSILNGAQKRDNCIWEVNSDEKTFLSRNKLRVFVPDETFDIEKFGLKTLSTGSIEDNFDGQVRHLKVYMTSKIS